MTIYTATLGFPRIGPRRELKRAIESYWKGRIDEAELLEATKELRKLRWTLQQNEGMNIIPSNDFSLYDHVLDMSTVVGAIPSRFGWDGGPVSLDTYFAMARGGKVPALEMTKWFDTNYHYLVPEFESNQTFQLTSTKPVDEYLEARALGIETVPVLLGPITYLLLGKVRQGSFDPLSLLPQLLPVYAQLLDRLAEAGVTMVQLDEPCLALDRTAAELELYRDAYATLGQSCPMDILVTTYFSGLSGDNLKTALALPVAGLHLDVVRGSDDIEKLLVKEQAPADKWLSLGILDGRNVWKANLAGVIDDVEKIQRWLESAPQRRDTDTRLHIAPSCSLMHVPWDLDSEALLGEDIKDTLAFAKQKLGELATVQAALHKGRDVVREVLTANQASLDKRRSSTRIHNQAVANRLKSIVGTDYTRKSPFSGRKLVQQEKFELPDFPTTTIGSFPQSEEVRKARSAYLSSDVTADQYEIFLKRETERWIRLQEEIGLDVLVHGEFERTDMVEYFGEKLKGFARTKFGWVQSYGTRCVKPPIIYGDVARQQPMTVAWSTYAQTLTDKPVKGMLTGPVTILQWSFVRDDIPRETTCRQIALAIRDEVKDLESAGIGMVQIDEPALREGLPLRHAERQAYLDWSIRCFNLATSGVRDETQIHTHMCYAEFGDIIEHIQAMDADVISMETSRSDMALLETFETFVYENNIGPGVYDIHSPRIPSVAEMTDLLLKACDRLDVRQIWVNPDCGLKTRGEMETVAALRNMVEAARQIRAKFSDNC